MTEQQLSPPGASLPEIREPASRPGKVGAVIRLVIFVFLTLLGAYAYFSDPIIRETTNQRDAAVALMGFGVVATVLTLVSLAAGGDDEIE